MARVIHVDIRNLFLVDSLDGAWNEFRYCHQHHFATQVRKYKLQFLQDLLVRVWPCIQIRMEMSLAGEVMARPLAVKANYGTHISLRLLRRCLQEWRCRWL